MEGSEAKDLAAAEGPIPHSPVPRAASCTRRCRSFALQRLRRTSSGIHGQKLLDRCTPAEREKERIQRNQSNQKSNSNRITEAEGEKETQL